jgi:hypothetical protein
LTWNINSSAPEPVTRIAGLMEHIFSLTTSVDVIFLQEVTQIALIWLRNDPTIRAYWILSDVDTTD